jgi:hypothetical protein
MLSYQFTQQKFRREMSAVLTSSDGNRHHNVGCED